MGLSRVVETEIYAEHMQFYVVDPEAEFRADRVWDGAGLERHLGVSPGIVAVGTVGYCSLPVHIELWESEPARRPRRLGSRRRGEPRSGIWTRESRSGRWAWRPGALGHPRRVVSCALVRGRARQRD